MWLINTSTYLLEEKDHRYTVKYAILSHRWAALSEEVSFKEYRKKTKIRTAGYEKIIKFCDLARANGIEWAWVDTCCIDKRSSADLTESINSMYSWYEDAEVCYVYLGDVISHEWRSSKWWSRGWTLQELIAPSKVHFFDRNWKEISNKKSIAAGIENITGIPKAVLLKETSIMAWTVAQRMAWAAFRETTRIEDRAYSLLGLFKVNMPMLYGEGRYAFQRLQIEILRKYPDESIFAWQGTNTPTQSVLADSPKDFKDCLSMRPTDQQLSYQDLDPRREHPPRATSWGIELRANARKLQPRRPTTIDGKRRWFLWALTLAVCSPGNQVRELPCTIVLSQYGPAPYSYRRYECHHDISSRVLRNLNGKYIVGEIEHDKLFYLWFDKDIIV